MFQRILVPLDGTSLAEEALPIAARLASVASAELLLVRVVMPPLEQDMLAVEPERLIAQSLEADLEEARAYLKRVITYEHLDATRVRTEVLEGLPALSILHLAQREQVDLIIIRSHGDSGLKRWLLGSMAQQLMRSSSIPLLILHEGREAPGMNLMLLMHPPRILVTLDGSPVAEKVLIPAAQLCAALAQPERGTIHLTYTVKRLSNGEEQKGGRDNANKENRAQAEVYLERVKQRFVTGDLAPLHLTVTTSVVHHAERADIWKRVIEESQCIGDSPGYTGCDIIAMATHGRHGLQRLIEGSVTEQVMDGTHYPLLVVHMSKVEDSFNEVSEAKHV
ncbi:MAG: universal stress protein [Ktedonobacteraceae bacterium]|nr:universal stress protein [Ktedonobacteraceae bacterium]